MAVAVKSRSCLHREKYDFSDPDLDKIMYLIVFSCINVLLAAKYIPEKFIAR